MSLEPLRVLHVASFSGNIGDNANHLGFRPWFERCSGRVVQWSNIEIREFYWNERKWDADFVALANSYDLVVFGGGNYFELWVDSSPTGTSIAIPPELLNEIDTPIFFNALGVDLGQGASPIALGRFKGFLDTLLSNQRYLVSVRNDGALSNLRSSLGDAYAEKIYQLPDAGFFCEAPQAAYNQEQTFRIAINLAGDMANLRFGAHSTHDPINAFAVEFAVFLEIATQEFPNSEIVFVPHIFRDLNIIYAVIDKVSDRLRRTRLNVAAYGSGDNYAMSALSIYQSSDLVLGMRFHANVCPIGMHRNTLGLTSYPQIANLYNEIGEPGAAIDVSNPGFATELMNAVSATIKAPKLQTIKIMQALEALRSSFEPPLLQWLEHNNLTP